MPRGLNAEQSRFVDELVVALANPAGEAKTIRRLLTDSTLDPWTLPALEMALAAADGPTRSQLMAGAGSAVAAKRVRALFGTNLNSTWRRYVSERPGKKSPTQVKRDLVSTNARKPASTRSPIRSRSAPATSATRVPLRHAGEVIERMVAEKRGQELEAARKKAAAALNKKPKTTQVCRECLREKPLGQFPNPARRRCADCGGQPPSRSVHTVSGGASESSRRRH